MGIVPLESDLEDFSGRKLEYLTLLEKNCAANAGFMGKSKLARSVNREFGDEMEMRVQQSKGSDRCMGKKVEFVVQGEELKVTFKMGRRTVRETHRYETDWEEVLRDTLEGDTIDVLDVAIHYPDVYWAARHQKKMDELERIIGGKRLK